MADTGELLRVRLRSGVTACPLGKPYELSFASIAAFDSVWVIAEVGNGRIGLGEAVPLPGYNWETLESIRATVERLVKDCEGRSRQAVTECCRAVRGEHPFAASAVMTALDLPQFLNKGMPRVQFPLSAPVASDYPLPELLCAVEKQLAAGYGFIKVKVGRNFDNDVAAARSLLLEWPGRQFGIVFDPNQAYTTETALAFAHELRKCDSPRLQWLEQPVDRLDWGGMERICASRTVPIVLDECIYDDGDIARAVQIGAHGVKLKLMKNFGIVETLSLARKARNSGLTVVFGNGVATDIGNLGEYFVLAAGQELFASPGECNGFAKLREPQLGPLLAIGEHGRFTCSADDDGIAERLGRFAQRSA